MSPALRACVGLALLAPLLAGCGNECSFHEQCDGRTLEVCGAGADQMFGRKVHTTDCTEEALDGTCVEIDDQSAFCISAPAEECDLEAHENSCEGSILTECTGVYYTTPVRYPTAYYLRTDCAEAGQVCTTDEDGAWCE